MFVDFADIINKDDVIAVAVSGGSDSMALLHYMVANSKKLQISVVAINVEHGIRGKSSLEDSAFVKAYCNDNNIKLLSYSVDCPSYCKENKVGIEEGARKLRYDCFYNAIKSGFCTKVATAHHSSDNFETILFNMFRGSGVSGIMGIKAFNQSNIIRPFLYVSKEEILEYLSENKIPYVSDETNFNNDYTRNFLRNNVLPQIKKIFPEAERSISRFAEIIQNENDFMDTVAENSLQKEDEDVFSIKLPCHKSVFSRATIKALKLLGMEKDWEKVHVDSAYFLTSMENGNSVDLPKNICAIKEYDKIVFYKKQDLVLEEVPFSLGNTIFGKEKLNIQKTSIKDFKSGLFADLNKIPKGAVIRTRRDGDVFTKFGGGTKSLNDYFTDKKIPLRKRDCIPLLAYENTILVIFGIAISDTIKVDDSTNRIIKFTKES